MERIKGSVGVMQAVAAFALPWAQHMKYLMGTSEEFSWRGYWIHTVGPPSVGSWGGLWESGGGVVRGGSMECGEGVVRAEPGIGRVAEAW